MRTSVTSISYSVLLLVTSNILCHIPTQGQQEAVSCSRNILGYNGAVLGVMNYCKISSMNLNDSIVNRISYAARMENIMPINVIYFDDEKRIKLVEIYTMGVLSETYEFIEDNQVIVRWYNSSAEEINKELRIATEMDYAKAIPSTACSCLE